jgi:hypothetical protein
LEAILGCHELSCYHWSLRFRLDLTAQV